MTAPGLEEAARQPAVAAHGAGGSPRATPRPARRSASPPPRWRANLVAVVFTVIFTRLLGADGYGSLAALLNLTRDPVRPRLGAPGRRGARGARSAGSAAAASSPARSRAGAATSWSRSRRRRRRRSLAREPLADRDQRRPGVGGGRRARHRRDVAAAVPAARAAAVGPRLPRGRAERRCSRRSGASSLALVLVGAGLGVTGAYLGTLASLAITAVGARAGCCAAGSARPRPTRARTRCAALARDAALPIAALTLVAALQNVDVIMAKHVLADSVAGVYAATDRRRQGASCGSPSASASGCCRRRPAAPPPGATRGRCWCARSR